MDITINGEPLQVELENEKNLDEVVSHLKAWLDTGHFVATSIKANGVPLRQSIPPTPLTEIQTLEIEAVLQIEKELSDLSVILDYCRLLVSALEEDSPKERSEIIAEFPYIRGGIETLFPEQEIIPLLKGLEDSLPVAQAGQKEESPSRDTRAHLVKAVEQLFSWLQVRRQEMIEPEKELCGCIRVLDELMPSLLDISVILQSGKDKEAIGLILSLTEIMQKATRIIQVKVKYGSYTDTEALESYHKELNSVLGELEEAFNLQDTVLIGDLVEYEILPRIEDMKQFIEK